MRTRALPSLRWHTPQGQLRHLPAPESPEVSWNPVLPAEEAEKRVYSILGKKTLDPKEDWTDVTDVSDLDAAGWRFFRVGVGDEVRGSGAKGGGSLPKGCGALGERALPSHRRP